jgi:hypothetical protein
VKFELVFDTSHPPYQRFPWRKHSANLHRGHTGTLQSIAEGGGIRAGNGEQQSAGGLGIEKKRMVRISAGTLSPQLTRHSAKSRSLFRPLGIKPARTQKLYRELARITPLSMFTAAMIVWRCYQSRYQAISQAPCDPNVACDDGPHGADAA